MKHWLLRQGLTLFPSLSFCLMAALAFWLLPAPPPEAPLAVQSSGKGVALRQRRPNGGEFVLVAKNIARPPQGDFAAQGASLRLAAGGGKVAIAMRGQTAALDGKREFLTLPAAVGTVAAAGWTAAFKLQSVVYNLQNGRLQGNKASLQDADNNLLRGDTLEVAGGGDIVVVGNVRARFLPRPLP